MQGAGVNQTPTFVETDTALSFLFLNMSNISNATLSMVATELSQLLGPQGPLLLYVLMIDPLPTSGGTP